MATKGSKRQHSIDDAVDTEVQAEGSISSVPAVAKPKKRKRAVISPGIVYISRLPPGMTPQKVRHLMARWGDIGKVYAQPRDAPTGYNPNSNKAKQKHTAANYSEAWVEFTEKSVAKTVARMLNAEVIGGKKGDRWRDDIWTMKYLSGFKWEMLGEQVAYERQAHQSRLRAEIARSKTEQGEYLQNVELARVLEKRRLKKAATEAKSDPLPGSSGLVDEVRKSEGKEGGLEAKKGYRQRQAVEQRRGMEDKGMKSVLGSVFG